MLFCGALSLTVTHTHTHIYVVVKMRIFRENEVLNIVDVELSKQLQLCLFPHSVTLHLAYTNPQTCLMIVAYNGVCETMCHTREVSVILIVYVCMYTFMHIYICMCVCMYIIMLIW